MHNTGPNLTGGNSPKGKISGGTGPTRRPGSPKGSEIIPGGKLSPKGKLGGKNNGDEEFNICNISNLFSVLCYILNTLAYLPYDYIDEPLQIIYWIGRNIPLNATMLLSEVKVLFSGIGVHARGEEDTGM